MRLVDLDSATVDLAAGAVRAAFLAGDEEAVGRSAPALAVVLHAHAEGRRPAVR